MPRAFGAAASTVFVTLFALTLCTAARAADPADVPALAAAAPAVVLPAAITTSPTTPPLIAPAADAPRPTRGPFDGTPVADRRLGQNRAGSATTVTGLTGTLQQTSATNVQTGSNAIRDGSFANALGLTTVIQNSGANVLIQNATTVNVQFK